MNNVESIIVDTTVECGTLKKVYIFFTKNALK